MAKARQILVIDDEDDMLESCARILKHLGYQCHTVNNSTKAAELISNAGYDLILTDLKMPGLDGMAILQLVKEKTPEVPVIFITGYATVPSAVAAIKEGAFDYLSKPFTIDQLSVTVERAFKQLALQEENKKLRAQLQEAQGFSGLIGRSLAMERVFSLIQKVAGVDVNVLITGESGTGKEVVARSLHQASARSDKSFVALDCAALPENLLESELFGYERGAFTGAQGAKPGLLELADQGTLFLDEIGELSMPMQVKLLRVLQERQFRRVGGTKLITVDMRVIAATNRDLSAMVSKGEFREDLYYRLNVLNISLPPLRDRQGDIPLLVQHFANQFKQAMGRERRFAPETMAHLEAWSWPGNVRELKNVVERAMVLAEGEVIYPRDLPEQLGLQVEEKMNLTSSLDKVKQNSYAISLPNLQTEMPYFEAKAVLLASFEKSYLTDLLKRFNGNISRAAEAAGIDRKTIHRLLKKHHLHVEKRH